MRHILQRPVRKSFQNIYLEVIIVILAVLISFNGFSQGDKPNYSSQDGYGFIYKRMAWDSVGMIPLASSPHIPYRAGGIKYDPSDSTRILVWTGNQWLQVGVNALEKEKLDRIELAKNFDELRSMTNLDTSVIYMMIRQKQISEWYYDPSDNTSVDDTASVIVTSGGERIKRFFGGIYRPEDFGAKGNGITDDYPAWQKMVNWINSQGTGGLIFCDARANYKLNTVINLPQLSNGKTLTVEGNSAKFTGNKIFKRRPPDFASQGSWQSVSIIIRNCEMRLSGTQAGSVAVDIGATYGSAFESNSIIGFDTAAVFRFGLMTSSYNNKMVDVNCGLVFTYGDVWGGGLSTSQSNGCVSRNDRVYGDNDFTGTSAFAFYAASDCQLKNFIAEGADMDYAVIYNDFGTTVTKGFSVENGHIEFVTGPDNSAFYIRQNGGQVKISEIYIQVCDTLILTENDNVVHMSLENWGFMPANCKIIDKAPIGNFWTFDKMFINFQAKNHLRTVANTGSFAADPVKVATYSASGITSGTAIYSIYDTLGRGLALNTGNMRLNNSNLIWETTNTNDIGSTPTSNAPRYVNAGTGFVTNSSDGTFRWGTGNGIGFGPVNNDNQVIRMVRGVGVGTAPTGSFGLPYGNTAQRTASNINGLIRVNSDSTTAELKMNNTWYPLATRDWVRSNSINSSYIKSGTYTPTLTGDANVDGTPTLLHATYTQIGNIVTCYVTMSIDPTANTTQTQVGITLPIASNFINVNDLSGTGSGSTSNGKAAYVQLTANISGDGATMIFESASTSASIVTGSFQYSIL